MLHLCVNKDCANQMCDYVFKHLLNIAIISIKNNNFFLHVSGKSERFFVQFVKTN